MPKQNQDPFPTSSIGLASYLHALGGRIIDIDRSNPQEQVFLFKLTDKLDAEIQHYYDGTGLVSGLAVDNSRGELFRLLRNKQAINT